MITLAPHISMLFQLRDATVAARSRTGDQSLGTDVHAARVRVIRVTYDASGASNVTPLTGYTPYKQAIAFLNAL